MTELISKDGAIEAIKNSSVYKGDMAFSMYADRIIDGYINTLPSVETTAQYDDFHEEIYRLTKELEYYQDRYGLLKSINDAQVETIRTYAQIVNMLDKELKELRGELT